jgi:hypothetical protein
MTAKTFFKKVGRGLQNASGKFTNAVGSGAGQVLGSAAAKYALEAAPALMMLKTGGHIPGKRHKAVPIIAHGSEYILPANAKPTKKQKAIVASNRKKAKKGIKFV